MKRMRGESLTQTSINDGKMEVGNDTIDTRSTSKKLLLYIEGASSFCNHTRVQI